MNWLTSILVAFSSLHLVEAFQCPGNSAQIPGEEVCYTAEIDFPTFFYEVFHRCQAIGGEPARIRNIYESAIITEYLDLLSVWRFAIYPAYIGVVRQENDTWTYSDGSPLHYHNWALNEPKASGNCAMIDGTDGKWKAINCSAKIAYVCTSVGKDGYAPCAGDSDWDYFEKTDSCYSHKDPYVSNGTWTMIAYEDAEKYCHLILGSDNTSHLVSIHSKEEDDFVQQLLMSNVAGEKVPDPCGTIPAWIGYYGGGKLGSGQWSDGTPVDYFPKQPVDTPSYWTISNDASCETSGWNSTQNRSFARYVCKMPAKPRKN